MKRGGGKKIHRLLKNKIDNFNEANNEVKKVIPILIEYKENILKVGGEHTKKYDNFLKSIQSNFSIYAVKRYSFSVSQMPV